MNDSLFNAELRDCARINEIQEQRAPASTQDTAQDDNGVIEIHDLNHVLMTSMKKSSQNALKQFENSAKQSKKQKLSENNRNQSPNLPKPVRT